MVKRYRISAPEEDKVFSRFAEAQNNFSFSIRAVVKAFVAKYGYVDATCIDTTTQATKPRASVPEVQSPAQPAAPPAPSHFTPPRVQPVSPSVSQTSVKTDSDGFVDPSDLL